MNKTIVIADDNAALCTGMRDFIDAQDGFEVVGVAQNGNDALKLIDLYKPDFVLLDIVMPELDGQRAQKQNSGRENRKPLHFGGHPRAYKRLSILARSHQNDHRNARNNQLYHETTLSRHRRKISNVRVESGTRHTPRNRGCLEQRQNREHQQRVRHKDLRPQRKADQRRIYRPRRRQVAFGMCLTIAQTALR